MEPDEIERDMGDSRREHTDGAGRGAESKDGLLVRGHSDPGLRETWQCERKSAQENWDAWQCHERGKLHDSKDRRVPQGLEGPAGRMPAP